jgi:hypothetical protein
MSTHAQPSPPATPVISASSATTAAGSIRGEPVLECGGSTPLSISKPARANVEAVLLGRPAVLRPFARSSAFFCTSLHKSEAHPLLFQPVAHSLRVYPGCHQERFSISPLTTRHLLHLSPLSAILTKNIGRGVRCHVMLIRIPVPTCHPSLARDLLFARHSFILSSRREEPFVTGHFLHLTPLSATLTENRGRGWLLVD